VLAPSKILVIEHNSDYSSLSLSTENFSDCCIRVTVLLEYLDLCSYDKEPLAQGKISPPLLSVALTLLSEHSGQS